MPTVRDLSALYENFMLAPRHGVGVCRRCFNLTDGYERCYACTRHPEVLDAMVPISYSVAHEQLHHALASYKRLTGDVARRLALQLAAVLWRFLELHEACVARAADSDAFEVVTTVPSGDRTRDERHPLRWIVSELVAPTRSRYQQLLHRSNVAVEPRMFKPEKFVVQSTMHGQAVLVIDDMWTTGSNAESAAAALKAAGAGRVAALVVGRHVNRDWNGNDRALRNLTTPFDWQCCALCAPAAAAGTEATAA
jgi:predicted amidophosphoribosyltransferase